MTIGLFNTKTNLIRELKECPINCATMSLDLHTNNMYTRTILVTVAIALLVIVNFARSEVCPEFDPFVYPLWPTNNNIQFGVSEVSDTNLIVQFNRVEKYHGALQYIRVAPISATSPNIVDSIAFDSGFNATLNGELYLYSDYDNMFQNSHYSSHDNEDCTVDISVDFSIQDLLSSSSPFTVVRGQDVITVDVPFYIGYAVPSRQTGVNWQYQENLFIARVIINTLVRSDGTKDVLNAACSSTVSADQFGVIVCFYTSESPLKLGNFTVDVTGSSTQIFPFYTSSTEGRSEVKFQTVDKVESVLQLNAEVNADICVVSGSDCIPTSDYQSPSIPYTFRAGLGEVTLDQEASLLFSETITLFNEETDAKTIIGATPEFFILVTTKTPKAAWRIAPGTDEYTVKLTSQPKYNLPSYPIFPTGNTVTVYTEENFPANVDPNVLSSPFISYILRFDNSRERYSRASENPILFEIQFNIENKLTRRRLNAVTGPTGLSITKALSSECSGDDCVVNFDESSGAESKTVSLALIVLAALLLIFM